MHDVTNVRASAIRGKVERTFDRWALARIARRTGRIAMDEIGGSYARKRAAGRRDEQRAVIEPGAEISARSANQTAIPEFMRDPNER